MEVKFIENLQDLLQLSADKTIIKQETKRLTAAGENYGSLMLAVKVEIKNDSYQETEEVELVAKLPPPNDFLWKMFNTDVTFVKEIEFYKTIMPLLQSFQREYAIEKVIDSAPKYFGSRLNLGNNNIVDNNAVLLLENLKLDDFQTVDRTIGFDFETARLILKHLAELQAIPIAIKRNDPDLFESKLQPLFEEYFMFQIEDESTKNEMNEQLLNSLRDDETIKDFIKNIKDIVEKNSKNFQTYPKNSPIFRREPYASFVHADLWVNNIMVKFRNNKPQECKFVDFQIYEYGSVARDLIFFLMTSVQLPVLENNVDKLIEYYHDSLVENLKLFHINTDDFTMENFNNELKQVLHESELFHSLLMLTPIYAQQDEIQELEHFSEEDMKQERKIPVGQKQRSSFIVNYLRKKSWI